MLTMIDMSHYYKIIQPSKLFGTTLETETEKNQKFKHTQRCLFPSQIQLMIPPVEVGPLKFHI